jgi:peptidoglycan/LPS O-acetylase OafA/YrhL
MDKTAVSGSRAGYRPDIDGLRAIAVIVVLFDHIGVRHFTGGYIGVDVFFVISGYLICSHLLRDIDAGSFSLARFYERRFRRIMPALLAMLAATSVLAYLYLFPLELKPFAQTEMGALLSFSNVVLLRQTDYFNAMRKFSPLLHTWSLGVEEQFYVVFPVTLFLLCRWGRRYLKPILWLLTVVGFLLACYWTNREAAEAFFLAPLRAWEFLLGCLLAIGALPSLDVPWKREVAALAGILLVLATAVHYAEWTHFPGLYALPPCVGAVLVLSAGETGRTFTGSLLSWGPIRSIGLISYSLYLWHWPIFVFQQTNSILIPDRYPSWAMKLAVLAASLIAAVLSWRFIEQPFRTGVFKSKRLPLFTINGFVFVLLIWSCAFVLQHVGWLPPTVPRPTSFYDFQKVSPDIQFVRWSTCYMEPQDFPAHFPSSTCLADDTTRPHYLLLGDSHAASAYWGLKTIFPELNISQMNITGCAPELDMKSPFRGKCKASSEFIFKDYLLHHAVDTVLLVGRWQDWDFDALQQTVEWLKQHGIRAVVFGPFIEFDRSLPRMVEVSRRDHDPAAYGRHRDREPEETDRRLTAVARDQWHVPYISMYEDLCGLSSQPGTETASGCPVFTPSGIPLLWDTDHLSPAGSIFFAQAIRNRHQLP